MRVLVANLAKSNKTGSAPRENYRSNNKGDVHRTILGGSGELEG